LTPHYLREVGTMSEEIIHKTPGTRGYRLGCRCVDCRAAQATKQAERRARLAEQGAAPPVLRVVDPGPVPDASASAGHVPPPEAARVAGPMEVRVIAEVESLWDAAAWSTECDNWELQALDAARRLDAGPAVTHVASLLRVRNEALRELRRLLARAVTPGADASGDEGEDIDEFLGTGHIASGMCQPTWPRVVPGVCRFCDVAARQAL
jgi:hypothetical protein